MYNFFKKMKSDLICKPVSSIFFGGFFLLSKSKVKFHLSRYMYPYVHMYGVCT